MPKKKVTPATTEATTEAPVEVIEATPNVVESEVTNADPDLSEVGLGTIEDSQHIKTIGEPKKLPTTELVYKFNIRGSESLVKNTSAVEELTTSIREVGQIDPIKYYVLNGEKVIFDGHCRFLACKQLGQDVLAQEIEPIDPNVLTRLQISTAVRKGYDASQKTKVLVGIYGSNPEYFQNTSAAKVAKQIGCNPHTLGIVKKVHNLGLSDLLENDILGVAAAKAINSDVDPGFPERVRKLVELEVQTRGKSKITVDKVRKLQGVVSEAIEQKVKDASEMPQSMANLIISFIGYPAEELKVKLIEELKNQTSLEEVVSNNPERFVSKGYEITLLDLSQAGVGVKVQLSEDLNPSTVEFLKELLEYDELNVTAKTITELTTALEPYGFSTLAVYQGDTTLDATAAEEEYRKMADKLKKQLEEIAATPEDVEAVEAEYDGYEDVDLESDVDTGVSDY